MQMREEVGKSRNTVFFQWFLALEGRKVGRKDAFSVAGAVQETCSSEMLGGPGADFLTEVAFWSIKSSVSGRWFCVTGAGLRMDLASLFRGRRDTLETWNGQIANTHWHEAVSSALSFPNLEGNLAELLRFWCCQLQELRKSRRSRFVFDVYQVQKLRKSRRIASFFMLVTFENGGSLAE